MAAVPSRGMMGGYPGGTHFFNVVRGTGIQDAVAGGQRLPQTVEDLGGREETLINHVAGVPLPAGDGQRYPCGVAVGSTRLTSSARFCMWTP